MTPSTANPGPLQLEIAGFVIDAWIIALPLKYAVLPFIFGLVAEKSKSLGFSLYIFVPFVNWIWQEAVKSVFHHENLPIQFEFVEFLHLLIFFMPAFAAGYFTPNLQKKLRRPRSS